MSTEHIIMNVHYCVSKERNNAHVGVILFLMKAILRLEKALTVWESGSCDLHLHSFKIVKQNALKERG